VGTVVPGIHTPAGCPKARQPTADQQRVQRQRRICEILVLDYLESNVAQRLGDFRFVRELRNSIPDLDSAPGFKTRNSSPNGSVRSEA
jgi:hypothetical protein